MREKLRPKRRANAVIRITPACAGKTTSYIPNAQPVQDHPRVCGKNTGEERYTSGAFGSPPRVREKLFNDAHVVEATGITPACAGKTKYLSRM